MFQKIISTSKTGTVQYVQITKELSEKVLIHIREYFYKQNNLYQAVKLMENRKSVAEQDELVMNSIADGFSLAAVDKSNEKVVGALITRIIKPNESSSISQFRTPSSLFIEQFLSKLQSMYNIFQGSKIDCALDFMFLSVDNHYHRQKIGTDLLVVSEIVVKDLLEGKNPLDTLQGKPFDTIPKALISFGTTYKSQRILDYLGHTEVAKLYYKDFTFNNVRLDQLIEKESPYCSFFYKKIV